MEIGKPTNRKSFGLVKYHIRNNQLIFQVISEDVIKLVNMNISIMVININGIHRSIVHNCRYGIR